MKGLLIFLYSVACYSVGFAGLLYWILSIGNLVPEIAIDRMPEVSTTTAILTNIGLVLLFVLPHHIMASLSFKKAFTKLIHKAMERSTFVLQAGVFLSFLVWKWEPIGGTVWSVDEGSTLFNALLGLHFLGWVILFVSTFLINHFDFFGLRQGYFAMINKEYTPIPFRVNTLYKVVRHPLYFGALIGMWATPYMTMGHLLFAILLSSYFFIGAVYEERKLVQDFGDQYIEYKKRTKMIIPFIL